MTVFDATAGEPLVGFKRHLRAEVVASEAVYLLSGRGVTALQGRQVEALAPLLDGTRTLSALLREAAASMPTVEAGRVLGQLARANLIGYRQRQDGSRADEPAAQAYWDLVGLDGSATSAALAESSVRVVAVGQAEAGPARSACRAAGLTVADADTATGDDGTGPGDGFSLVLCDDYLAPELAELDARHRAAGRPWLLAKPYGAETWVGPVFQPGAGPCWSCLAHRLREHRSAESPAQRARGSDRPLAVPEASLIAGRTMGLQAAVLEASKWLAGVRHAGQNAVCTLDTIAFSAAQHRVTRRPQCAACGDPALVTEQGRRPVVLASRPKPASGEGHHRAVAPARMLEASRHLVSPVTGIVTELRRAPNAPEGVNAYVSGRNLALSGRSLAGVRSGLRTMSGGKGTTALEAEVGALCEAVERYCATRQGDEATVRDTLNGLGGDAVHPNDCQLFHQRQFRDRDRWNAGRNAFQQVCPEFDPDRPTDWSPVWSLTRGTHRMLPTSMLYFVREPGPSLAGLPWADSNGNAAGSSIEDAVVHGFLELVERDAVALWWYNRTRHPAVDLDAFDEPWLTALRTTHGRLGRTVWALDLTSDLGVPVVAALSHRPGGPPEEIAFGFGAHFDPRTALRRAVTEMGQLLPPGGGEGLPPGGGGQAGDGSGAADADPELTAWWQGATVRNQPYLLPDPAETARTPADFAFTAATDFRQEVEAAEQLARSVGSELLVLDQSRPDVGIPVVKVLVPGLRHFWARFAPGRLYDVPVQRGLLDRPTPYESLNPTALFV